MKAKKIKLPSLRQMQLGRDYQKSARCGCLMFHADRIDNQIDRPQHCWQRISQEIVTLDRKGLRSTATRNSLRNRRAAMSMLRKALRQCGYRIARDKKTAVLK